MGEPINIDFCKDFAKNHGYEVKDDIYIKSSKKMSFIHSICGESFSSSWNSFQQGHRCPKCAREKLKISLEECLKYVEERGFTILNSESFTGSKSTMSLLCPTCDKPFSVTWNSFKSQKTGCPKCANEGKKLTLEYCKEYCLNFGYEISSEKYVYSTKNIEFIHLDCGNKMKASWANFTQRKEKFCYFCFGYKKFNLEFYKNYSASRGYEMIDFQKITRNPSYITLIHSSCKFKFKTQWKNFYNMGQECPRCSKESGESQMAGKLKEYYSKNSRAIPEYNVVKNPKTGKYLPFDLFISSDDSLKKDLYIEINGEQHYEFVPYWHKTIERFLYSQYRDSIKIEFAKSNGIYIEVDLRKNCSFEEVVEKINNFL